MTKGGKLIVADKRSVLIVEDEEIIRRSLKEVLLGEGYDVGEAESVADALRLARERDFDVAFCDVQLPDGDGIALLRRLHQLNAHTCILIITAYATVENAVEAFKAGAFDYLVKPVDTIVLKAKIIAMQIYLQHKAIQQLRTVDRATANTERPSNREH